MHVIAGTLSGHLGWMWNEHRVVPDRVSMTYICIYAAPGQQEDSLILGKILPSGPVNLQTFLLGAEGPSMVG